MKAKNAMPALVAALALTAGVSAGPATSTYFRGSSFNLRPPGQKVQPTEQTQRVTSRPAQPQRAFEWKLERRVVGPHHLRKAFWVRVPVERRGAVATQKRTEGS